ncbi:Short-chain dehydrogenase [Parafrankia irregularis]|uniref:Short-chain dehydrogenase n=1 Tax=Parafrankia irregularis TaxID=795642 RepID=A0A0S4QLW2_9ACTN|nr:MULTISPECIES: SDR family oxidoreductase [Parafrankia]CUU56217.1 Short-chain dehydrogenase [Parafrankia irregularis]
MAAADGDLRISETPGPAGPGTVLITGGSSGLGAATVAAVRAAGGRPLVLDRVPAPGVPEADREVVDLAATREAEAAVRTLVDRAGGQLHGVFTAAGTDTPAPLAELDGAAWERIVAVNLLGTAAVVRAALPYLRHDRDGRTGEGRTGDGRAGRIVTCASTLGLRVAGDASAYCASKFGVVGFTRALAEELKGQVGVTLLVPGGMSTAFFDDRDEQYKPGPGAKLNRPEDVAATVVFALGQPSGCELREIVVTSSWETSYP